MVDSTIRGQSVGFSRSLESDKGIEFASRYEIYYECDDKHTVTIPFFSTAQIPAFWDCKCGKKAALKDSEIEFVTKRRKKRTPWNMYCERRSKKEMKENFNEIKEKLIKGKLDSVV